MMQWQSNGTERKLSAFWDNDKSQPFVWEAVGLGKGPSIGSQPSPQAEVRSGAEESSGPTMQRVGATMGSGKRSIGSLSGGTSDSATPGFDGQTSQSKLAEGVIVIHGTDTLSVTGERIVQRYPELEVACVLTGAMRPWMMRNSDALQNLVESFTVVQLVPRGVYVAMHNRVLQFPGVIKDQEHLRFVRETKIP